EVDATGANISEIIEDLEGNYPGLKERICEDDGTLRRFVNVYLNDEDIRFADNMETALKDGDELSIIPAIAGGRGFC
ncbi:MAG: ubiquitin-like small modifier protein 1, partial [Thermodesulfobacteriota bacterium]